MTHHDREDLFDATTAARSAWAAAACAAALAAERAFTVVKELDVALSALDPAPPLPHPTVGNAGLIDALSPREREVLVFVAEGRTNKAIAEALYVSPNTIKTHVASLLAKLHAETRTQLAAIAVRHALR